MTQEDKELLLIDLCARIPYGVKADYVGEYVKIKYIDPYRSIAYISHLGKTKWESIEVIKPYLRPMSSMTEKEKKELEEFTHIFGEDENGDYTTGVLESEISDYMDWLLQHHFDFRGLIEKGLAIEVTKKNNSYED